MELYGFSTAVAVARKDRYRGFLRPRVEFCLPSRDDDGVPALPVGFPPAMTEVPYRSCHSVMSMTILGLLTAAIRAATNL
jgi:hypothetical protein